MANSKKLKEAEVEDALITLNSGLNNGFINFKNGLFVWHKGKTYRLTYQYCRDRRILMKAERIAVMGVQDIDMPIISCIVK